MPDTLAALTACARARRRAFAGPVVAVTGSNGKTTTKEMIGAILAVRGPSPAHEGQSEQPHRRAADAAVACARSTATPSIEMGANHRGEIAHLASIAEPGIGIVTNAGAAHLEGFGSLDGVAEGKGELFAALPPRWRCRSSMPTIATRRDGGRCRPGGGSTTFGLEAMPTTPREVSRSSLEDGAPQARVRARRARAGPCASSLRWRACTTCGTRSAQRRRRRPPARRSTTSPPASARCGRSRAVSSSGPRSTARCSSTIRTTPIPGSLKAGLDAFRAFAGARWLVLGDMMELGTAADDLHREIGAYARQSGVERLLAVGPRAKGAADEFGPGGAWFETRRGSDQPRRAAACARTSPCWSRDRGPIGLNG